MYTEFISKSFRLVPWLVLVAAVTYSHPPQDGHPPSSAPLPHPHASPASRIQIA